MRFFSQDKRWAFEVVEGDPYGHPFPTSGNVRGANADPWVVDVSNDGQPYATIYARSGKRDTCEQAARELAESGGDWRDALATFWWSKGLFLGAP